MDIIVSSAASITVRLYDLYTNSPLTNSQFPTIYAQKYNGSSYQIDVSPGINWFEVDSINMPGVYTLTLSSTDTSALGQLSISVIDTELGLGDSGAGSNWFVEIYNIVSGDLTSLSNEVSLIRKFITNKTEVDFITNTYKIYDDNNTTVIKTFSLYDKNDVPTTTSISKRVPN